MNNYCCFVIQCVGSHQLQKPLLLDGVSDHSLQQPKSDHEVETTKALDSSVSIERQLEEVFGPNHDESCASDSSFLESTETKSEENLSTKDLETVGEDVKDKAHTNLDERNKRIGHDQSNPTSDVDSELEKTHANLDQNLSQEHSVTSSSHNFENEDDFISREAQALTREILEDCVNSSSSLGSIGNISKTTKDTKSEENLSIIKDHGFEEDKSKHVLDKSLQTSFGNLSIDSDRDQSFKRNRLHFGNSNDRLIEIRRSFRGKRAVSAGPSIERQTRLQSSERPKFAGLYLERKSTSSTLIFIDMHV